MEKSFERSYSLNVARLKYGQHEERFLIGPEFFTHFEKSPVTEANLEVLLDIFKYDTHLDVKFHISGTISLQCDRCLEPYNFPIESDQRIIYSFDERMNFEGEEVMFVDSREPFLSLVQELYDFVVLTVPLRQVPDPEAHLCDPNVLKVLGLDENGVPRVIKKETEVDPRWEALKKLKETPKEE